jgi:poly(A) polymerase
MAAATTRARNMPLQPITIDRIDPDALKVVRRLVRHGYQAFLVGGCVRDLLVGRVPKDYDVATSATPEEMRRVFRNCRIIGRRFRLAQIFFGPKIIETATFRKSPREEEEEASPDDGQGTATDAGPGEEAGADVPRAAPELLIRRDNVFGSAEEDARRRDFTINGLFFDVEGGRVVDHVNGLRDLEAGLVRSIGDPDVRFREDPVRILRAIRMSARLGFEIEPETRDAMAVHRAEISKCAPPRVLEEFYRIFRSGASVRCHDLLRATGVLAVLAPELDAAPAPPHHALGTVDASVERGQTPSNAVLLAILSSALLPDLFDPALHPGDATRAIEERFDVLARRLVVPRRERERARLILTSLRRLAGEGRNRRPMALVRRDFFGEALFVFEAVAPAALRPQAQYWRRLAAGEPVPVDAAPGPRRRRRRRRGGRRREMAGGVAVQ